MAETVHTPMTPEEVRRYALAACDTQMMEQNMDERGHVVVEVTNDQKLEVSTPGGIFLVDFVVTEA